MLYSEHLFAALLAKLRCPLFQTACKMNPKDFTRQRLLPFMDVMRLLLQGVYSSTHLYLTQLFARDPQDAVPTKSAFCRARYKLRSEALRLLNDLVIDHFYAHAPYRRFSDRFVVLAADGSTLQLPSSTELVAHFGVMDNKQGGTPSCLAKVLKVYDVLNELTLSSFLSPYAVNEIATFKAHYEDLGNLAKRLPLPAILTGDVAYPSFINFHTLPNLGMNFVFRCKKDLILEFTDLFALGKSSGWVDIDMNAAKRKDHLRRKKDIQHRDDFPNQLRLRVYRKVDPRTKEVFVLVTNLNETQISDAQLDELYRLRWGVETSLRFDKCVLKVEQWASKKVQGIEQEWYATVLEANLTAILAQEAQTQLDAQVRPADQHPQKVNRTYALGLVRQTLNLVLDQRISIQTFCQQTVQLITQHHEPVRPNRSAPRKRKHNIKYHLNYRPIS